MLFRSDWFLVPGSLAALVPGAYQWPLVLLSYLVATAGASMALYIVSSQGLMASRRHRLMVLSAATLALGGAIWSMHFIGMLALSLCTTVTYDTWITVLSAIPAILAARLVLRCVAAQDRTEGARPGLAAYYTERGETPGVWVGSGARGGLSRGRLAGLGLGLGFRRGLLHAGGLGHAVRHVVAPVRALFEQRLRPLRIQVMNRQRVPCFEQIHRHGLAHVAQANEKDAWLHVLLNAMNNLSEWSSSIDHSGCKPTEASMLQASSNA